MSVPQLVATQFTPVDDNKPVLLLGPGLGTGVEALWGECAAALADDFFILGYDLPGHVHTPASTEEFEIEDLADAAAELISEYAEAGRDVYFAGVSVSGGVAQMLGIRHGDKFKGIAAVCTSAKFGEPQSWIERAELVAKAGTPTMVSGSAERWFAPRFIEKHPVRTTNLLHTLQNADRFAYAHVALALSRYDVREQLKDIAVPLLVVSGAHDVVSTPEHGKEIANSVQHGTAVVIDNVAHQAPLEEPEQTAKILRDFFLGRGKEASSVYDAELTLQQVYDKGMVVRRQVLSDAHVDRANANKDDFTDEFQDLISKYAWGTIWTRPGLDRRMRSAVTLTAMIAGSYWDEFAMHVKAARRNGLTVDEIKEVVLQSAIYCSVPAANVAFSYAKKALAEYAAEEEA